MPLSAELPWLFVSVAAKKDLDAGKLKLLEKIKMQSVHFDAAHSNLNDSLLNFAGNFSNLTRLNLSNTAVTDVGLKEMGDMPYLDYLNLSGTAVDDGAVAAILQFPKLRNLFVWNSKMTPIGLERIKAGLPQLHIDIGAPADTSSKKLRLRPPKIEYARNIFDDTVQVTLDFPFRNVGLHYSTDETEPTSASTLYKGETFVFDRSVRLRAVAVKQGWADSKTAEASFLRRKWKPRETILAAPPSPKYLTDPEALSDSRVGASSADKTFIAYEGAHFVAVMDYGQEIEFRRIYVHYTENNDSWIFAPRGLTVWVSADGKQWTVCLNTRYPAPEARRDENSDFISENLPKPMRARFIKVRIESQMNNPAWHPGKGKRCWVFVDEILAE